VLLFAGLRPGALELVAPEELADAAGALLECFEDPQARRTEAASTEATRAGTRIRNFTP
jgi:hypothetical protein